MFNDIICDHFMNPRNIGELTDADYVIEISNPICGDTVHM
ncbi:iron-sulfur cluster assembly scaffold protein, partial [Priestia megaterium]